ncbi:DMT family transporter, partial [Limosilactobacillus reuteri]
SVFLYGKKIFNVFKTRATAISVISYAILGLMANLLTFYYAIQTGNASAATILQYLSPLFIVLGGIVFMHRRPFRSDIIAFVVALIGVALCITRGNFTQLALPFVSLLWGLGSGITAAFYVVLPQRAADENPPIVVLGWGTMIAGVLFNLYRPFWVNPPHITTTLVASVATVVLFGTILPFGILLHATRYAPSDVVSIMDAVQPITTSILSVIFFKLNLNWAEILGIILVIIAVYILQNGRRKHTIHY